MWTIPLKSRVDKNKSNKWTTLFQKSKPKGFRVLPNKIKKINTETKCNTAKLFYTIA